jgi:hypothetical protein
MSDLTDEYAKTRARIWCAAFAMASSRHAERLGRHQEQFARWCAEEAEQAVRDFDTYVASEDRANV